MTARYRLWYQFDRISALAPLPAPLLRHAYYCIHNSHRSKELIDANNAKKTRQSEVNYTKADREIGGWCFRPTQVGPRVFNIEVGITLCLTCKQGFHIQV